MHNSQISISPTVSIGEYAQLVNCDMEDRAAAYGAISNAIKLIAFDASGKLKSAVKICQELNILINAEQSRQVALMIAQASGSITYTDIVNAPGFTISTLRGDGDKFATATYKNIRKQIFDMSNKIKKMSENRA